MKKIIALLITAMMLTAIFTVCVSADEDLISPLAAGNELVNVAEGKSYVPTLGEGGDWRMENDGDGENGERQKLTDGVKNETTAGNTITAAYKASALDIVVDLGEEFTTLKKFNIDNYWITSWGISKGLSIEYSISSNGTDFTSIGVVATDDAIVITENEAGWNGYDHTLELDEAVSARYVKISYIGGNYLWASEIQIFNEQTAVEEPSSTAASSDSTTETGDIGYVAIALIAVISLAAVTIAKKSR